ncbi:phytanoyl dioxygenase family [Cladorrhinum sp. PSN332]|nr:phytanoyl dioxygenase family [Cladorrhinum sp. PSN332]
MSPRVAADLPKVEEFTSDPANCGQVVQALIQAGGAVIRSAVPQSTLDIIEKDTRPYINADKPWNGDFFPRETRRVYGLAGKSPEFIKSVVANPLYQAVCNVILKSEFKCWIGQKLETSSSPPQLNNTIVFSISPGARNQELHRDDMIHHNDLKPITADEYKMGRDTGIGFFVAGKKRTKANGATRFVPGSHLWDAMEPPNEDLAYHAELNPGDAFIMLASCYHGGSANTTENEERLIYSCFMTKGYLRQEENQYLANPLEKVRQYPTELQKLIGYQVSNPFLGWLDLDDPRKALYGEDWDGKGIDLL